MNIQTSEQLAGCWVATTDEYDGPGSPIGQGFSEQEAIDDLLVEIEYREEARAKAVMWRIG